MALTPQASYTALLQSIPCFLGVEGEDVYRWVLRLERLAAALHVNDEVKLAVALARLDECAYDWSEAFTFDSFSNFKRALLSRYGEGPDMLRLHFRQCKQRHSEGIQSYADRFRKLAARASCTEEAEILKQFLAGLSSELYDRVIGCRPAGFDEALQHSLYFERMSRLATEGSSRSSSRASKPSSRKQASKLLGGQASKLP